MKTLKALVLAGLLALAPVAGKAAASDAEVYSQLAVIGAATVAMGAMLGVGTPEADRTFSHYFWRTTYTLATGALLSGGFQGINSNAGGPHDFFAKGAAVTVVASLVTLSF